MLKKRVWYKELWLHENVSQNDIFVCLVLQIIRKQYFIQQSALLESLEGRAIYVAGDGRCDGPGHNALFGMYSLMDVTTKKIFTLHVLKVKKLIIFGLSPYLAIWFNYHLISKNRNFAMPSSPSNRYKIWNWFHAWTSYKYCTSFTDFLSG